MKPIRLSLIFFLAALIPISQVGAQAHADEYISRYSQFAPAYLATFPAEESDKKHPQENSSEDKKKKSPFRIPQLTPRLSRELAFQLLISADKKQQPEKSTITSEQEWDNLTLLSNDSLKPEKTVISAIKRTESLIGELTLAKLLTNPTTDIAVLRKRQESIRALLEHPEIYNELQEKLKQFAAIEPEILSLMRPSDPLYDRSLLFVHHDFPAENPQSAVYQSPFLSDCIRTFLDIGLINNIAMFSLLPCALLYSLFKTWDKKSIITGENALINTPERVAEQLKKTGSVPDATGKRIMGTLAFSSLLAWYFMPGLIKSMKNRVAVTQYIRTRARSLKTASQLMRSIAACARDIPQLASLTPVQTTDKHEKKSARHLAHLKKLLGSSAVSRSNYFGLPIGSVLALLPAIQRSAQDFLEDMVLIGELDALLSCARLMREHAPDTITTNTEPTYSFVSYILPSTERETPFIKADNFWHPMLPLERAVTNSITLGVTEEKTPKDLIITGPNAAGKSTIMKALTLSILFGQTIGIAPAQSLAFTPFSKISTYLNITDDLANGRSLFKAELYRARELIETIENLKVGEFSFTILDEILTGTEAREGEAAAYGIGKYLSSLPQSITTIATHFPALTKLEEATDQVIQNYRVTADITPTNISYPYTLIRGINDQQIALTLLEHEGYAEEIVAKANDVLAHPDQYRPATTREYTL